MKTLIISCSLSQNSKSRILATATQKKLQEQSQEVELFDLNQHKLPFCDDDTCYEHPNTKLLKKKIEEADGIIIAIPVYNYTSSAQAKNLIELTGKAWQDKVVGFLCAAGGSRSYMAPLNLANSLMLDFRCIITPRFVYATGSDFQGKEIANEEVNKRITILTTEFLALAKAIAHIKKKL